MILSGKGFSYDIDLSQYNKSQIKYIIREIKKDKKICYDLKRLYVDYLLNGQSDISTVDKRIRKKIASMKAI